MQSRRNLLTALSAGSVGMLVPHGWLQPLACDRPLAVRMAQLFSDRDLARTVGKAHLKSQPDNTGVADVALRLVGNPDQHARLTRADDRTLRRFLHLCRQRDFKSGRTVFIDGWVLSETEANLCAVVALLPSSQRGNGALAGLYV